MSGLRARRLGARDLVFALRALRAVHGRAAPRRRIAAFLADRAHHLYVAAIAGEPVALAYGYELPRVKSDGVGFVLYEIDTRPEFRRRGAARAVLEAMRDACRRRGVDTAWVPTNASNRAAMRLYRSTGAVRPNRDDVMLRWHLGAPDPDELRLRPTRRPRRARHDH